MYAGAAVDGDAATARVPDAAEGTLTADLGRAVRPAEVSPEWTRTRPASHEVRTSLDGRHWREGTTGPACFVRVTVRSADDKKRAGIEELRVTRAKWPRQVTPPSDPSGPGCAVRARRTRSMHAGSRQCAQQANDIPARTGPC
ncbi:hypothetical protein ACWDWU_47445 [Streptomyces sp. NPDC003442]